jgi:hypothetical protein
MTRRTRWKGTRCLGVQLGHLFTETWSSKVGGWTQGWLTTLLCKKSIVVKSKDVKTGCTLANPSEESYGLKRGILPMMMISAIYLWFSIKCINSVMTICMSSCKWAKCTLEIRENLLTFGILEFYLAMEMHKLKFLHRSVLQYPIWEPCA